MAKIKKSELPIDKKLNEIKKKYEDTENLEKVIRNELSKLLAQKLQLQGAILALTELREGK